MAGAWAGERRCELNVTNRESPGVGDEPTHTLRVGFRLRWLLGGFGVAWGVFATYGGVTDAAPPTDKYPS